MPTIERNKFIWSDSKSWDESNHGENWSTMWGSTELLWKHTILKRVKSFYSENTLEIAPGHGRITEFLASVCSNLTLVDISQECLNFCQNRFSGIDSCEIKYLLSDGLELPVENDSIEFVFSWDSLVHCEAEVIESYLKEIQRVLIPESYAFIHCSNFKQHVGKPNRHMRAETVDSEFILNKANANGLKVSVIEEINWGEDFLNDCFVLLKKTNENVQLNRLKNYNFLTEAILTRDINQLYAL